MKLLRNISLPLIASLALFACERDYDAPLLTEPEYTGPAANITISELRTQNAAATQDVPIIITQDQVLKAVITGNDESGNIFKKIYLQDETGAIEMEVDQSSVYNYYPVGQTVYVDLNGLSISVYGDEQQLGHPEGYLYRTPWEDFEKHVSKDGWANPENAKPVVIDDISTINAAPDNYKFKLVQFTGVTFQNGGKGIFAPEDGYGEENITDSHGNTIMIRTSNYASFAGNKLPEGKGNVTGILGRFRGTWQLTLRTANDVSDFTGSNEEGGNEGGETPSGETVLFQESFGTPEKSGNYWPKIAEYTGFDNPGFFEDESGKADVRIGSAYPANVWFPKGSDINLKVKGINGQGATKATLKYQVGCNVYNSGETQDLNTLKIKCNGTELPLSSKVVSGENQEGNKPFEFEIKDINISNNTTLEFYTTAADNTYGLRLFSVKLYVPGSGSGSTGGDGGTTIEPTPSN
ncbi:DUF5689 domain-containing protein [Phocaeicola plebeius]|jgi:hypothetical protein|uniref:DUF5689 domain-containing protein n=1 Tax=Phocaeicola plebeius TaxID=310297 RepID=UPI001C709DEC|nr:DUF5689 domain-containing protein [Phocaeicola plebeius]